MGGASYAGFPDYIGVESYVDVRADTDEVVSEEEIDDRRACWRRRSGPAMAEYRQRKEEYPPLIPLLAQTENLHSHMPWVLTRHYTPDGRLILTKERVRHHEYFRAHRHDGRLTLQLVALDDEVWSYRNLVRQCEDDEYNVAGDVPEDRTETLDSEEEEEEVEGGGSMKAGMGSKCLGYKSVGSPSSSPSAGGSCMLGMMMPPLPAALWQVHS
ncbi:hypothetical protein MLD38_034568 [Melastoma candidum]|uniref:Uncharacterized protein n=1 Tax=Melastoma candidum TaxID=119954 RepID=A0ACB9MBP2_9MYRT|nr:hypothetical protein MLD38_034568 [Melastoma candidum]